MKHAFENDEEDEEDSLSSSGGWQTEEEDEHEGQHESALDVNALEPPTAPLTENQKVNQKVLQDALTAPLTAEQDEAVNAALANGSATEVLASGSWYFADITLKRMDVATMAPGQWLNDEMVNFTLGTMVAREARRVGVGAEQRGVRVNGRFETVGDDAHGGTVRRGLTTKTERPFEKKNEQRSHQTLRLLNTKLTLVNVCAVGKLFQRPGIFVRQLKQSGVCASQMRCSAQPQFVQN